MLTYEFQDAQFPQPTKPNGFAPPRAKEGFIVIAAVKPNNFAALWRAIGHPEYATDHVSAPKRVARKMALQRWLCSINGRRTKPPPSAKRYLPRATCHAHAT
jgi:hypothetical protein